MRELKKWRIAVLELTCTNGCSYRCLSQPTLSGTKGATWVFFSGIHFAKLGRFCNHMNLKTMCEDTSHKTEEQVCISCYWEWVSAVLTTMKSQETEVVLWGNGMWTLHIHYFGCAESNVSYCNTMEIRGFKEALKTTEENGTMVSTSPLTDIHKS